jgi:hypothetical protein
MRKVDQGRGLRSRPGLVPPRGLGQLRRRPGAAGEVRHPSAPHRGAGVRRQPRQRRPPVRARLLAAAPPPEGHRGGSGPRHGRGHPPSGLRRRREGGSSGGLCRGRHGRVHRRCIRRPARRPYLVHGDEHPPAGRASGHRDGHRPGPGRVAAAGGLRRASAAGAGRDHAGRLGHGGPPLRREPGHRLSALDRQAEALPPARGRRACRQRGGGGRRGHALLRPDDRQADRPRRRSRGRRPAPGRGLRPGRGLAGQDQRRLPGQVRQPSGLHRRRCRYRLHRGAPGRAGRTVLQRRADHGGDRLAAGGLHGRRRPSATSLGERAVAAAGLPHERASRGRCTCRCRPTARPCRCVWP